MAKMGYRREHAEPEGFYGRDFAVADASQFDAQGRAHSKYPADDRAEIRTPQKSRRIQDYIRLQHFDDFKTHTVLLQEHPRIPSPEYARTTFRKRIRKLTPANTDSHPRQRLRRISRFQGTHQLDPTHETPRVYAMDEQETRTRGTRGTRVQRLRERSRETVTPHENAGTRTAQPRRQARNMTRPRQPSRTLDHSAYSRTHTTHHHSRYRRRPATDYVNSGTMWAA